MDDLFAPMSVAKDLLGLGSSTTTSAPAPASGGLLDFGGSWSITADMATHSLAAASMAANSSRDAVNMAHMQPVETQLRGLANVSRYSAQLDQSTLRVVLDLSWVSKRGALRSGRVEVSVTHGLFDAVLDGQTCELDKPARLLNGSMYACNLLRTAAERAVAKQVERENTALDAYEGEFGVPVASPALPGKADTDGLAQSSLTAPLGLRDYPLPGGDLSSFGVPLSSDRLPRMAGASLSSPQWEQGLAEERERQEMRRLGMQPIRDLLAAPAGVPATEFRYHGGVLDVVYGRNRIKFLINATTGGLVMDGHSRLTEHPARKVGDTIWVSRDVLDLAKAADEAAAPSRSNRAPVARPAPAGLWKPWSWSAPNVRVVDRYGLEWSAMADASGGSAPGLRVLGFEFGINDLEKPRAEQLRFLGGELRTLGETAVSAIDPTTVPLALFQLGDSISHRGLFGTAGLMWRGFADGLNPLDEEDPAAGGAKFMGSVLTVLGTSAAGGRAAKLGKAYASGEWQYLRTPFVQYAWQGKHKQVVLDAAKEAVLGLDGDVLTRWHWLRVARLTPRVGDKLYRVWGWNEFPSNYWHDGKVGSQPLGQSWTMVDPRTSPNFRHSAGLPDVNPGRFLVEGTLRDTAAFGEWMPAKALDGHPGGWPEWLMKPWDHPGAIRVDRVLGLNAQF